MPMYLVTVFLGSFLLFEVQPLIGRYILPWFGGSPAVWTTCMLFFQVMLLAGYCYAHLLTSLDRRRQAYLHAALLATALAFLPIAPSAELWKPAPQDDPIAKILLLLLANIGAPYFILSATAPLVQHWFAVSYRGRSPYRLYALSNAASFLALFSYPFLVEPKLTLASQVSAWSWGFAIFVLCCGWCALLPVFRSTGAQGIEPTGEAVDEAGGRGLEIRSVLLWLLLSACGSAALLATTNQLCQEVAVVPFLWVAPLALYLATFTICFDGDRWYKRRVWAMLFAASLAWGCWLLRAGTHASLPMQIAGYLATLFTCCMTCHSELARSRPGSRHLTAFYLTMAAGGALGGTFVALAAPLIFDGFWEFPLVMIFSAMAVIWASHLDGSLGQSPLAIRAGIALGTVGLGVFTLYHVRDVDQGTVASSRNFYGVLRVIRSVDQGGPLLFLRHGRVMHGSQYISEPRRNLATTYYGPESGAGLALRYPPRTPGGTEAERPLRVGIIGLGTGTLASYGRKGDTFRFYEINSDVVSFADRYFTFRRDSGARIETATGDARILLESELKRNLPQRFDVLILDAFSSDSIPVHLLTRESFELYRYHLNPDGALVVHVTNHFLNLIPVVQAQAEEMGLEAVVIRSPKNEGKGVSPAEWMILTRNTDFLSRLKERTKYLSSCGSETASPLWTDDFVSPWPILKR